MAMRESGVPEASVAPGAAVAIEETAQLIAAGKVGGTPVYNRHAERLGTVEDVMLDKRSGRVAYAVMSFGGFLGIGERYHAVPWSMLDYEKSHGGYVVPFTKEQIEAAPAHSIEELSGADGQKARDSAFDYYKVDPYWN